jgi:FKBP-type peptidyl-prolyl cis-trans isomerase
MRIALLAGAALMLAACGEKPATDGAAAPTDTASTTPAAEPASADCKFDHAAPPAAGAKASDVAAFAKYVPWNKAHPDAKPTPSGSGVQYVVLASGDAAGKSPSASQQAEVFYEGRLNKCGPAFDSAFERNASATFPVNRVVPGFSEALQLMKPGDRWLVYIPADLAYGAQSPSPDIPPNSDLVFEIEMVAVH